MITIEVLIAMLILFLVIASSFENIKFFTNLTKQQDTYENYYINVLNIKAKYANSICKRDNMKKEGEINGFQYTLICKEVQELRNYKNIFDTNDKSGNIGQYMMKIFRIDLQLKNIEQKKDFYYFITRSELSN